VRAARLRDFARWAISPAANRRDLYNLAARNGRWRAPRRKNFAAATLQDARAAFARVAADIGTVQFGYYPTNKVRDGKFRSIKVEVRGLTGKNEVRAREGYQAPKG
jgi:hypothetical protein